MLTGVHVHDALPPAYDHLMPPAGEIDFTAFKKFIQSDIIPVFEPIPGAPLEELQGGVSTIRQAWDLQEETLNAVVREKLGKGRDETSTQDSQVVYFCEHPHVFTLGKSGANQNLLIPDETLKKINATYYKSDRGGDITYHGPGQIVGYPIIDLEILGITVKDYVWKLEESVIGTLDDFGIKASRFEGSTGVWLDTDVSSVTRKICAIGVRVSRYVTMHGFALNVNTDLGYFQYINPCGFIDKGVTSMQQETGVELDMQKVSERLKTRIAEVFQVSLQTKE